MNIYQTKAKKLPGSNYQEVYAAARRCYNEIKKKTKRRPYIRASYWQKEKVFFDYCWPHLAQKPPRERMRRLRYLAAAIELLQKSRYAPATKSHASDHTAIVHRFAGKTKEGDIFYVQVKEDKKSQKYFMSCFPH